MNYYGMKLDFLRQILEITQEELAKKISVNYRTVSYWENEQRPITRKGLISLIKNLGVNPFWIMWDSSKFANINLAYIKSFIKKEIPEEFRNLPSEVLSSYYPDKEGNIDIFYSGSMSCIDTLNDYKYDENILKEKALRLINEIEEIIPYVNKLEDKMKELKILLDQKI